MLSMSHEEKVDDLYWVVWTRAELIQLGRSKYGALSSKYAALSSQANQFLGTVSQRDLSDDGYGRN